MFQTGIGARHADVIPHQFAKLAVEFRHGALALDRKQFASLGLNVFQRFFEFRMINGRRSAFAAGEITANGLRQYEITIGQSLHQR